MDKQKLVTLIKKNGVDYTQHIYLVGFFCVFILLIIFVVRPTINSYVIRQREYEETKELSAKYQKSIENLTRLQGMLETHREDFTLLDLAVPKGAHMYELSQDISDTLLDLTPNRTYQFPKYTYIAQPQDESGDITMSSILLPFELQGTFPTLKAAIDNLFSQLRLKTIKQMSIQKPADASPGAQLRMGVEIEAYHL